MGTDQRENELGGKPDGDVTKLGIRQRLAGIVKCGLDGAQREEGNISSEKELDAIAKGLVLVSLYYAGSRLAEEEMSTYVASSDEKLKDSESLRRVQEKARQLLSPLIVTVNALTQTVYAWEEKYTVEEINCPTQHVCTTDTDGKETCEEEKVCDTPTKTFKEPTTASGFLDSLRDHIVTLNWLQYKLTLLANTSSQAFDLQGVQPVKYRKEDTSTVPPGILLPTGIVFIFYEQIIGMLERRNNAGSVNPSKTIDQHHISRRAFMKLGAAATAVGGVYWWASHLSKENANALDSLSTDVEQIMDEAPGTNAEIFERYFGMSELRLENTLRQLQLQLENAERASRGMFSPTPDFTTLALTTALSARASLETSLNQFFGTARSENWQMPADVAPVVKAVELTQEIMGANQRSNITTFLNNWAAPPALVTAGFATLAYLAERFVFSQEDD